MDDDNAIQARQRLVAEQEEVRQPLREANAKRNTKLTRAIKSDALGIERRLRRADRAYKAMFGHEAEILALGKEVERFDLPTFITTRPGKLLSDYIVNKCSEHFGFGPRQIARRMVPRGR